MNSNGKSRMKSLVSLPWFHLPDRVSAVRLISLAVSALTPFTALRAQNNYPSRLIDISCRAQVGTGANQLIVGYAIGGQGTSGSLPLLIRASGPALAQFGVTGVLSDPDLTLNQSNSNGSSTVLATNAGWGGNGLIASTASAVGAFAWKSATSSDSALVKSIAEGAYTAQVVGGSGDAGVALAEVYDATPSGSNATTPRLINISARVQVGTGGNILIAGFVIGGTAWKTVLIRGSGPALKPFGVSGVLPDPKLQLFQSNSDGSSTLLNSNTGWAGNAAISAAAASAGAFSWGSAVTPDSAILITLPPGAYTTQVSGASGDGGVALVEIYDLDPPTPPLLINAVAPQQGPTAGGTTVALTGSGFTGATVSIDNQVVTPSSQSDSEIDLPMPAHDNGYAVISVNKGPSVSYGEFLYVPPRLQDLPQGYITTVAGVGQYVRDFGSALNAAISPAGIVFDPSGNLYIAEPGNNNVCRVRPDGTIQRVTAPWSGGAYTAGDGGLAIYANISFPETVAVDPSGNIYIADSNYRIRKIDATSGTISTIAGVGVLGYTGDNGPATAAAIGQSSQIAADANDVFFIDFSNGYAGAVYRIRRIHLADGSISTFAGTGTPGFSGDGGPATQAQFDVGGFDAGCLALDAAGNLYLADTANYRIRRIDRASGVISTFYTLPTSSTAQDFVREVRSLAFDVAGDLYFGGSGRIVEVNPAGTFLKSWGNGSYALQVEGSPAASTGLGHVRGIGIDRSGNIIFSDDAINRVRRIDIASGEVFTVAGIGPAIIGETGPAIATVLNPLDLKIDATGNLLIGDSSLRLRRVESTGQITTIAGTGSFVSLPAPTLATEYGVNPVGIDLDTSGNIEMTMGYGCVIAQIDKTGTVHNIVGQGGVAGYSGDGGPATQATLCDAWDAVRDAQNNLIIADTNNNRIRRVDGITGIITTIVGNGGPVSGTGNDGQGKSSGDGGPAISAAINAPYGVAVDASGNLFIAETASIRKVSSGGTINTFAAIPYTTKLRFDAAGSLYAARNFGIFRLDASANQTWLAGDFNEAKPGFSGDGGPASQAKVNIPYQSAGIAIDSEGNLYFADNYRVRAIRSAAPTSK